MTVLATYPLDNIDYAANDAALYHCTRTTGIYAGDDFSYSLSGADNTIRLEPGLAWMRLTKFKGQVAALKLAANVDMGLPDVVYPRIDHVVLQFDANKNDTQIVIKHGVASSNPQPPERSVSEALYEIHLIRARREPGAASITAKDITDLRMDPNYCGLMADSVTRVDTSAIYEQIDALIKQLREEINAVKAGTAYIMKSGDTMTGPLNVPAPTENTHAVNKAYVDSKHLHMTAVLLASGWSGSGPYTQAIAAKGITEEDHPHIGPVYASDMDTRAAQREAWALVSDADTAENAIVFTCDDEKPAADITIQIEVNR